MSDKATKPTRPALRYHGGKWKLAERIIAHFPPHRIYTETFGGGASVLLRKPRSYAEVYNDLYDEVVTLFCVLRDPAASARLVEVLRLTPFARAEFDLAYEPALCPVEQSRRLIVRSLMGFGSDGFNANVKTGFRANSNRSGTTPAHDWAGFPASLIKIIERVRGLVIERRPAIDVMRAHDGPETLHYADPPYMPATRSHMVNGTRAHSYIHEMTVADHADLLEALCGLKGMVVLSGYPHPLYDEALPDWQRVEMAALADGAKKRTEVLWINPAATAALGHGALFAGSGA